MKKLRIAIVATEASGDLLGADLICALRQLHPDMIVEGMAGPNMIEAGCTPLFRAEEISVMGLVDPIKKLPRILKIRRALVQHFLKNKPDIFIGIDSPDFNLSLAGKLKRAGIKTVQYVSPSIWAWRQWRIHQIKKAVDLMLTLLPFEADFYHQHQVPVQYIGHPLADQIALTPHKQAARTALGLPLNAKILAILPGSRASEIKYLTQDFIRTANYCEKHEPDLHMITAMINDERTKQFESLLRSIDPDLPIKNFQGSARQVIAAADVVLLASGTATLEALLLKRPMVVSYRLSWINYFIAKLLIRIKYFSLPNLIANKLLVKEFFQRDITPKALGDEVLRLLQDTQASHDMMDAFTTIHHQLKRQASQTAAKAILEIIA